ncbi:DUF5683 domain-containing protein [Larkinella terrae]|uniref:DUF5683 domain-containing protein n=1 Tax=Larkinella terrae TaxID=2025311 RepID=A0A7K0EPR1_9BACT|nr:DUF5683 domain-containing protein [Larkinella terrae]MRS63784.1 hypothetical protein [Larkinella terrae]
MKKAYRVIKSRKWRKYLWIGAFLLLAGKSFGQNPSSPTPTGQTELISTDSTSKVIAADTVPLTAKQNAEIRKIVPRKSTIRSALVPGWGQISNGHWWKVPIIYAGFGTMVYFSLHYRDQFKFYKEYGIKAYESSPQVTQVPGYTADIGVAQLERAARAVARYRDYNLLGCGLLWGVNVIEANVTAHLKTFDISEDLTMQVKPGLLMPVTGPLPVPGVRIAFQFKN